MVPSAALRVTVGTRCMRLDDVTSRATVALRRRAHIATEAAMAHGSDCYTYTRVARQ